MPSSDSVHKDVSQTMWVGGEDDVVGERHGFLERGDQLGRYLILSRLGTGGMGVVYAAYDPDLDRKVAIKLLRRGSSDRERRDAAQRRLMREARAMARLAHPNVITVHDVAEIDGRVFVAMEFVDGRTFDRVLAEPGLDWRERLAILMDAGRGLAAAHDAGVIHRDFKPENVMLDREGRVRVMDFGLAGSVETAGANSGQFLGMSPEDIALAAETTSSGDRMTPVELPGVGDTRASTIVGTPAYMSPEQHEGRPTDARTDQFSFCVTVYEALYGVRPFEGDTAAEIARSVKKGSVRAPPEQSKVPSWIHAVIVRGLARRPEDRYPCMGSLLAALRADPAIARRRWMARGTVAVLLVVGAFGVREGARAWTAEPCAGARARADEIWSASRRDRVQAAFETVDKPWAGDAWQTVSKRLEHHAASWVAMHRDACEANKVRGEQSDHLLDLRMQCLDRRLAELDALVELFAQADERTVRSAVEASYALVGVDVCADTEALFAPLRPPDAEDERARLGEIRQQLAQIKALEDAGRFGDAMALAPRVVERARELDYAPLSAEALLQQARLAWRLVDLDASEQLLRAAIDAAAEGKHHEAEARAWVLLVMVVGYGKAKPDLGQEVAHAAMAAVKRAGDTIELRAELANARGALAAARNELEEAEVLFRETLALHQQRLGDHHPKVANALNNTSVVLFRAKRTEEARVVIEDAIAIYERSFGEEHPILATLLVNLASISASAGRYEEGQAHAQRAMDIFLRDFGPHHVDTGRAHLTMAHIALSMRRFEVAKTHADAATSVLEPQLGEHPQVAAALGARGAALRELGEHASAVLELERATALAERTLAHARPEVERLQIELADAYVAFGRNRDAIALLEPLIDGISDELSASMKGRVRFVLAQALWFRERERTRALAFAEAARDDLVAAPPEVGFMLPVAAVDRWLAEKRP